MPYITHAARREAVNIEAAVQLHKDLDALTVRAEALAKHADTPGEMKDAVAEFARYCRDTLSDCDMAAAVERYEAAAAEREAGEAADYARESRRDDAMLDRVPAHGTRAAE